MYALSLELCVIQSFYGIHGLIRIAHVHKGKLLYDGTLCDSAILFKQRTELIIEALFYISYMEFDRTLVISSAGLYIDLPAI